MKIEEFCEKFYAGKKGKQYEINSVMKLSEEFKARGLESYLWLNYREIGNIENNMTKVAKYYFNKPIRKKIIDTVQPVIDKIKEYVSDDLITFVFTYVDNKNYYLANYLSKQAKYRIELPNLFGDTDTINLLVVFDKVTQTKEAYLCYDAMCNYNYNRNSRMDQPYVNGYKIFERCLDNICTHADYEGNPCLMPYVSKAYGVNLHSYCAVNCRIDNHPKKIIKDRNTIEKIMSSGLFKSELEMAYSLMVLMMYPIHDMFMKAKEYFESCKDSLPDSMLELEILYSELAKVGLAHVKWDSELELYKLVKNEYPDTIYQYCPEWLHPQSLDIYIPSLGIGIEYNGRQHYESIDFYGGDEGLIERQELDSKKIDKCKDNGIRVISWKYDIDINKDNLDRLIKG